MRRALGAAAAIAVAVAGAGARPECAHACSCAPLDPERALAQAEAAVVATVAERRSGAGGAILVLDVERRLKGPVGDRVEVATATGGAACGVDAGPGERVGLFLSREAGVWRASLCAQARPAQLAVLPAAAGGEEVADAFAEATAYALALVAAAAIGVFLLRRRFRPD